jgi:hypothetical protein
MVLDLKGQHATDVRPARQSAGRKLWAKDPTTIADANGTRLDATFINDVIGLIRGLLTAYEIAAEPGDDAAIANAVAAAVAAGIATRAPIASPDFTGTPKAPTAAPGTSTTQIASTAFVMAAVAALVDASPTALDTLNELAAALGDDQNFAATMTTALAGKQALHANLTAFAGLALIADRLPYADGDGTLALATFTAFGRTLAALADAAAGRTALGAQVDLGFDAVASQAEAEAGTAADKAMNPLRVAQAIAALAPGGTAIASEAEAKDGTDNTKVMTPLRTAQAIFDMAMSQALMAMEIANLKNIAQFLGGAGNGIADSFDDLSYVDVAGATNLADPTGLGLLKPTVPAPSPISGATGTPIGDMSGNGGLAAAYDGNENQANTACAFKSGAGALTAVIGKDWGSTKKIGRVVLMSSNDRGFISGADPTVNFRLLGNTTNNAGTATQLATGSMADGASLLTWDKASGINFATGYAYHWVEISHADGSAIGIYAGEAKFYESQPPNNMTVRSKLNGYTAAAVPTRMKGVFLVKEGEAATAGIDYQGRFSRDNGTSWSNAALTELFSIVTAEGTLRVVITDDVDVSGQASGNQPIWEFKTLNNKDVALCASDYAWRP